MRMVAAHVPEGFGFSSKLRTAQGMSERARGAHLKTALWRAGKGYVLGIKGTNTVKAWIDRPWISGTAGQVAQALPPSA